MRAVVVIGLGNRLLSDEGVGLVLADALAREADGFPGVEFLDLGTGGLAVLHALAGRRAAVIVDCARMGTPPATLRRFGPEAVRPADPAAPWSLHEGRLLEVLSLARRLGDGPARVLVFGIEPERLDPGLALSPCLQARVPEYLEAVRAELRALAAGP